MANDRNIRPLIQRMLDSGKLLPETVEELRDYLEELNRKGSLDRMDADYVQGLAQRLGFEGKGKEPESAGGAAPPPAANDSTAGPGASIARAREFVEMLYDPETGLLPDVSDERASEILGEVLQSLDDAESAISRR